MQSTDLIDRLRAWARRYDPRSPERTLFLASAARIEDLEGSIDAEVTRRLSVGLTAGAIEEALGGDLLPWQRKRLQEKSEDTPPSSPAA
jgi:hypothetical protein